nr:hypothetical protein [Bradyrhizobium sp. WSM2254]
MANADFVNADFVSADSAKAHFGDIPRQNPCAQCGTPIPRPDWIEPGEGRISYLWTCRACNYHFEAVAIFDEVAVTRTPLAA